MSRAAQIRDSMQRYGVHLGLVLVAIYTVLRTAGAGDAVLVAWTALAVMVTLILPVAGLTLLAALGPFTEAQTETGWVTPIPFLVAAFSAGVIVRIAMSRSLPRPNLPLALALILLAGTGLGVAHSLLAFGEQRGIDALQAWVVGIGGGLAVLLGAAYVAWRGELRPAAVAVASITLAAGLGLLDFAAPGSVMHSGLAWLLRDYNSARLTAIIPAPNAAAAIFLLGAALGLGTALFARRRELRMAGLFCAAITIVAVALTFSRSGLLGIALALAVLALGWRHRVGITALGGVALLAVVAVAAGLVREVPAAADTARIDAWLAAARMWLADPLLGHGFGSFEWLHSAYGSVLLDAPHNEWLRFFAEEGVFIGLAGLAFAIVVPITILRARGWFATSVAAAAAGFVLMAGFNNPFLYTQVNVPAFLVIGTGLGFALAGGTSGRSWCVEHRADR